jgi:hypothetical protein
VEVYISPVMPIEMMPMYWSTVPLVSLSRSDFSLKPIALKPDLRSVGMMSAYPRVLPSVVCVCLRLTLSQCVSPRPNPTSAMTKVIRFFSSGAVGGGLSRAQPRMRTRSTL